MLNKLKTRYSALKNGKKGFTLIELVVVIAIMAILALIMVPNLTAYIQKGDDAKVKANMKNVHTAAELTIQSNPKISVKDIATDASIVTKLGATGSADLKAEIAKFSNLTLATNPISFGTVGTTEHTYYLSPKTDGRVLVTYSSDRFTYSFDGVEYLTFNQ